MSKEALGNRGALVPCATFTMRTRRFPSLHERVRSIEIRLHESVATYRPDVVVDERFRATALRHVRDPIVRTFWEREFASLPPNFRAEVIAPV
jgi:hypothetical protein